MQCTCLQVQDLVHQGKEEASGVPGIYGVGVPSALWRCEIVLGLRSRLPLAQSKQKFLSMDEKYREDLKEMISGSTQKFQLEDINYGSFVAKFGYRMLVRMRGLLTM